MEKCAAGKFHDVSSEDLEANRFRFAVNDFELGNCSVAPMIIPA
jgi:hypothetical protein